VAQQGKLTARLFGLQMSQSRTRKGLLSLALSKRECGEECYKLCVAFLLCCNNYNYTPKTATARRFFSALCCHIKRGGGEFFA